MEMMRSSRQTTGLWQWAELLGRQGSRDPSE